MLLTPDGEGAFSLDSVHARRWAGILGALRGEQALLEAMRIIETSSVGTPRQGSMLREALCLHAPSHTVWAGSLLHSVLTLRELGGTKLRGARRQDRPADFVDSYDAAEGVTLDRRDGRQERRLRLRGEGRQTVAGCGFCLVSRGRVVWGSRLVEKIKSRFSRVLTAEARAGGPTACAGTSEEEGVSGSGSREKAPQLARPRQAELE